MDGVHDLGGKPGYGRVAAQADEPVFQARWEAAVFAMMRATAAAGALGNADRFRHAIERIHPGAYLTHGYYGRWLGGLENLLVEAGLVTQEEIRAKLLEAGVADEGLVAAQPARQPPLAPEAQKTQKAQGAQKGQETQQGTQETQGAQKAQKAQARQASAQRSSAAAPRFQPGDLVQTAADAKPCHTRLPAYARGRRGQVIAHHGAWVFPDSNAHGEGENPQHLYTVSFASETLWQAPGFHVHLDLFEPYLAQAKAEPHD